MRIHDIERFLAGVDPHKWVVQPKYNGHRALPTCDKDGRVRVLSRHLTPLTLAKDQWEWLAALPLPRPWQLDGELTPSGQMVVWDYSIMEGISGLTLRYCERLEILRDALHDEYIREGQSFSVVSFLPALKYQQILSLPDPAIEGLVFKNLDATDFWSITATREVPGMVKFRK